MNKTAILAVKIISDSKGANAGLDQTSAKVGRLSGLGLAAKAGLLAAGAGLVVYGTKAVGLAGDLEQSVGAVDTVFGKSAAQMHRWAADAANNVGLTKNEFNELGTLIGTQLANGGTAMDKLAPKTNELIGLGADLSSMFGGSTKDAVAALSSALKGERDPIERYGVSLKQSSIDAKAAELGYKKVGGSLSNQAQQAATLALIMEQTSKAQGNFSRETDTLAHQQQVARAQFDNFTTSLGTLLLPVITTVMTFFNSKVIPVLQQVATVAQQLSQVVGARLTKVWSQLTNPATRAGNALAVIQSAMAAVGAWAQSRLMPALTQLGATLSAAFSRILPVITGIVDGITKGMAPAMPVVKEIFGTIGDIITGTLGLIGAYVTRVVDTITRIWQAWGPQILNVVTTVWTALLNIIAPALDTIKAVIATVTAALRGDWSAAWNGMKNIVSGVWRTIVGAVTGAMNIVKSVFALAWSVVARTVSDAITRVIGYVSGIRARILGALSGAATWLANTGRNLIEGLWNGINDKVGWIRRQISGFVDNVKGWFKDFFGIHSPSRVMADLGRYLPAGLAQGITGAGGLVTSAWSRVTGGLTTNLAAQMPAVERLASQLANALAAVGIDTTLPGVAAPATAGGGYMVVHLTVNGAVDVDATGRQLTEILDTYARRNGLTPINGKRP